MGNFITKISDNAKVAIGLIIAEKMFDLIDISDTGYKIGREALDSCWKWLEGEEIEANDLCDYIDSEDYIDVAEFANKECDEIKKVAWYSVLDAVSYTIRQAYNKENRFRVPQAIEVINDTTLIILCENAVESGFFKLETIEKVKKHLLKNYPSECVLAIKKEEIMSMVIRNH